jgi:hypothetical protein
MGRTICYCGSIPLRCIKIASLKDDTTQGVNGQRLKHYIAEDSYNEDVDVIQTVSLEEFIQDNMQEPVEFIFEHVTVLVRKGLH